MAAALSDPGPAKPYPSELEEHLEHRGWHLILRPICPDDMPRYRSFLTRITAQDLYHRFFTGVRQLPEAELARLTRIDYEHEMAFVALMAEGEGQGQILGVARACLDPDRGDAEFAVLVRSDLKRRGLGTLLMQKLIRYCGRRGTRRLWGSIMMDNEPMLQLAHSLGFHRQAGERNIETVSLDLQPRAPFSVD